MDGFRFFMNCVCMCIFAAGPMRIGDFALLGNQNMGGGVPVATLVHGDPAPAVIASAYRSTVDSLPLEIIHSSATSQNNLDDEITSSASSAMVKSIASLSTSWRWHATLTPDATRDDWKFGAAVSIYERTIAVGPARDWDIGVDQGGVQLYTCIGEKWLQSAGFLHPTGDTHAQFGACVALHNHMLLVGAPRDSAMALESGAAFLYEHVDDQWQLNATLLRTSANDADQFGAAVACDENTLVIGAPKADQGAIDSGAVEVFERDAHGWHNVATLVSNPPMAGALFGLSVAIDAGHIIVGAPGDRTNGTMSGRAFLFTRGANGWTLDTSLSYPIGIRGWFGTSVAIHQDCVLVGAPRLTRSHQTDFDARGAAFEFKKTSDGWRHVSTIMPANSLEGDSFGCSLALHKQHAVFGASTDSLAGWLAGAAFAGKRLPTGQWNVERLRAPDCAEQQLAGHVVGIYNSRIVVGRMGNPEEEPPPGALSVFTVLPLQSDQKEAPTTSPMGAEAAP